MKHGNSNLLLRRVPVFSGLILGTVPRNRNVADRAVWSERRKRQHIRRVVFLQELHVERLQLFIISNEAAEGRSANHVFLKLLCEVAQRGARDTAGGHFE